MIVATDCSYRFLRKYFIYVFAVSYTDKLNCTVLYKYTNPVITGSYPVSNVMTFKFFDVFDLRWKGSFFYHLNYIDDIFFN